MGAAASTASFQPSWAELPPDILSLIMRASVQQAQGDGPMDLPAAAALLASLSPCRAWRAAALAQAPFRLRLGSYAQLQHPLLLRLPLAQLVLPEQPADLYNLRMYSMSPQCAAAAQAVRASGAADAAAAAALLGSPTFKARSGSSLRALERVPLEALVARPGLLAGFERLEVVGLAEGAIGMGTPLDQAHPPPPPGSLPPSLRRLSIAPAAQLFDLSHWLPPGSGLQQPLEVLEVSGRVVSLWDGAGAGWSCDVRRVMVTAEWTVYASVALLAGFSGCQEIELRSRSTEQQGAAVILQPLPDDEAAVWELPGEDLLGVEHGPVAWYEYDYGAPAEALLRKWLRVLAPLFAANPALQTYRSTAAACFLRVFDDDPENEGGEQILSPLPPQCPPGAPPAGAAFEATTAGSGLVGRLERPAPGAPQLTQLTVTRAG